MQLRGHKYLLRAFSLWARWQMTLVAVRTFIESPYDRMSGTWMASSSLTFPASAQA